ncbi:hypothetical protein HQ590_02260 [bacterium]|nr:hypothetical protein [bacterium]
MTRIQHLTAAGAAVFALACTAPVFAQLRVVDLSEGLTPEALVDKLPGGGVEVFNVEYTGVTNAAGIFCDGRDAFDIGTGILLTSGGAKLVLPPNDSSGAGQSNELDGDPDLDGLIPGYETFDACILEFDFVPVGGTVQFNYVFASEEYNEFVDSSFNDVFGFFINGVNYALIPGTVVPVSINNVNNGYIESGQTATGACQNCAFYVDNAGPAAVRDTQMDGLTTVLTLTAPVVPGTTNHMKIAIADAGDTILDSAVFLQAGSLRSGSSTNIVTRNVRFWFTHATNPDPRCVTLEAALRAAIRGGCQEVDLGFITLPQGYRNDDNVRDAADAVIEALGLYYRSSKKTGELAGRQTEKLRGSKLCRERKRLAVEYLAALGNSILLGTQPSNCTFVVGGVTTSFPADLLDQARAVLAGDDRDTARAMGVLLRRYNGFALTNNFAEGRLECSPDKKKTLKALSRDPTTQATCPGQNDQCESATAVIFKDDGNPFSVAKFKNKANLFKYHDYLESPSCGDGGREAVWKVKPDVGANGRHFTVSTQKSNFNTLLSVYRGSCDAGNLIQCDDDAGGLGFAETAFSTDGTNTYYIVVEGAGGAYGKAKIRVTSP